MTATKRKISLTLSADVVDLVDVSAQKLKETRSGVVELWLRRAAHAEVRNEIADATAAYYLSLRGEEREDDASLSRALSAAARRVSYDEPTRRRRR